MKIKKEYEDPYWEIKALIEEFRRLGIRGYYEGKIVTIPGSGGLGFYLITGVTGIAKEKDLILQPLIFIPFGGLGDRTELHLETTGFRISPERLLQIMKYLVWEGYVSEPPISKRIKVTYLNEEGKVAERWISKADLQLARDLVMKGRVPWNLVWMVRDEDGESAWVYSRHPIDPARSVEVSSHLYMTLIGPWGDAREVTQEEILNKPIIKDILAGSRIILREYLPGETETLSSFRHRMSMVAGWSDWWSELIYTLHKKGVEIPVVEPEGAFSTGDIEVLYPLTRYIPTSDTNAIISHFLRYGWKSKIGWVKDDRGLFIDIFLGGKREVVVLTPKWERGRFYIEAKSLGEYSDAFWNDINPLTDTQTQEFLSQFPDSLITQEMREAIESIVSEEELYF
ncbi:MAG: hypothetical protein ACK4NT_07705, partial [Candidatus Omnitrophota bacterium]